jgi:hypothetical protein
MNDRQIAKVRAGERCDLMVPVDSDHPAHANMFKTLDLLKLRLHDGSTLHFVVEGCAQFCDYAELQSHHRYFYEVHTCPTNFVGGNVVAIFDGDNDDPHGIFEHVASEWMPQGYVEAKAQGQERDVLQRLFPQLRSTDDGRPALGLPGRRS